MKPFICFILTLINLMLWPCSNVTAQNEVNLPATFQKAEDTHNLPQTFYCIVGDITPEGKFVWMLSEATETTNRIATELVDAGQPANRLLHDDIRTVWIATQQANGTYHLTSASQHLYLTRVTNGKLGLKLTNSPTSNTSEWTLIEIEPHGIAICDATNDERSLQATFTSDRYYFNNFYNPSPHPLSIYILTSNASEDDDNIIPDTGPDEGTQLTLSADPWALTVNDGHAGDFANAWLRNNTLAPTEDLGILLCKDKDDDGSFALATINGTSFLQYNMQRGPLPQRWQMKDNHLLTVEDTPRIVSFNSESHTFMLSPFAEAEDAAQVSLVSAYPSTQIKDNGLYICSGGWANNVLAELTLPENASALDLTSAILPRDILPFKNLHHSPNIPVYIMEGAADDALHIWPLLIACSNTGNRRLVNNSILADRQSFSCPYAFEVSKGQLSYLRTISGITHWQTLSLPFSADIVVDEGVKLYSIASVTTEGTIALKETHHVLQHQPIFIYNTDNKEHTLSFSSVAGIVNTDCVAPSYSGFRVLPHYIDCSITAADTHYLLQGKRDTFVRAAKGSHVSPFRFSIIASPDNISSKPLHFQQIQP